ncbi:MAG: UbiX family flavin prenyltransferase [Gemmatimonadetes bacterium]|nr:UbiX family flavin prenyltransferase [Gemmatimonadota bacterium]
MAVNRTTVAVTGASGAIYALRTLRALLMNGDEVHLIVSGFGWMLLREEAGFEGKQAEFEDFLADRYGADIANGRVNVHQIGNMAAPVASGSVDLRGMVVVPCSMKYLANIAHGASGNLIERAADVTLKERRPLILVPRETPMNLIHLRNMTTAAEAGAAILPAMPAFYQKPETFDDLADFIAGRILNLLGIEHDLFPPWTGI